MTGAADEGDIALITAVATLLTAAPVLVGIGAGVSSPPLPDVQTTRPPTTPTDLPARLWIVPANLHTVVVDHPYTPLPRANRGQ